VIHLPSDPEIMEILTECYKSTGKFCKTMFPHYFTIPFSEGHEQMFQLLDDPSVQRLAIAAPRDFGKSTIANAYAAKNIVYEDSWYTLLIGANQDTAVEHAENLKDMLTDNEYIQALFPDFKSDEWARTSWTTSTGRKVLPLGAGQKVRGHRRKARRPDLILLDDIENDENVLNEEQRLKLRRWFFSAVCNSVQMYGEESKNWKIVFIGTVLHEDSLLMRLLNDPTWTSLRLEICDDNFVSKWPAAISDERIKEIYLSYAEQGEQDSFAREYRNMPISTESAKFKAEHFRYYTETEERLSNDVTLTSVVLGDPAKTHGVDSCNSAIVGVTIDLPARKVYVRDVVARQLRPDEFIAEMLDMAVRIGARFLAPEVTSLNEYLTFPLENAMKERGLFFNVLEIKPRDKKELRAAALIPLYRSGRIWHRQGAACAGLEMHLLSYPRCAKWDEIDALAHVVPVMEELNTYFINYDNVINLAEDERLLAKMRAADEESVVGNWQVV
jgi:hypothetical protein